MIGPLRATLAFLVLALAVLGARGVSAAEVIQRFDSSVQVAKDGMLTVTETVRVRAEGREIRRGIFRDFPLTFKDAAGTLHEVSFSLIDVTRDGKAEPHFTERKNGGILRIYAGDKDTIIARGDHVYVLRYTTARQIRWFDGKPELNWNVTGNFWNFPILAASYRLELPGGVRPLRWTAYSGRPGARGTDWRGGIGGNGVLTVASTRTLAPAEGLTVVAEIPAGAVEPPSQAAEFWYSVRDNRRWIFGGFGFLLVLIYYTAAWSAVGRDPKAGIVIPLFHPPEGISPALANYINVWGFAREKWRAFTAAALALAVRGLLHFDDKDKLLTLKTTGREPQGGAMTLPAGERAIFTWLSGHGGSVTIDKSNSSKVADIGGKFTTSIETENKNKFFRRNLGYVVAGAAMTVAVVAGVIAFGGLRDQDIFIIAASGFAGFWFGMFLVPLGMAMFGGGFHSVVRVMMTLVVLGVFVTIGTTIVQSLFPSGIGEVLPQAETFAAENPFPLALVTAFASLNGLFFYLMRAPTALGRPVMDQLAGFKLYLETAESDRLNLQAPEIDAERFETLLPYAVALDVEKPWSEAFAAALKRAHPDAADPALYYQPAWRSGGSWSGSDFSGSVAATVSSVSSALASAAPASSGSSGFSSGGGGSGGGGGGGGGGGW